MNKTYLTGEFRKDYDEIKLCPRCDKLLPIGYPGALSRLDNETEICSQCGVDEAMLEYEIDIIKGKKK